MSPVAYSHSHGVCLVQIPCTLEEKQIEALDAIARERKIPRSAVIRKAVAGYLERNAMETVRETR